MKNYDGWALRVEWGGKSKPYLIPGFFRYKRSDVIKYFERIHPGSWKIYRCKGHHKIVKVKIVEVK